MKKIYVADDYKEVINEAWSLGEEMLAHYGLASFETLAGINPEDFKNMQTMIKICMKLKDVSFKMAEQMDQQAETIYNLEEQNEKILESLGRLETKLSSIESLERLEAKLSSKKNKDE